MFNPSLLPHGCVLRLAMGRTGYVGEYIGGGGQSTVCNADCQGRKLALKWYHHQAIAADPALRQRIGGFASSITPKIDFKRAIIGNGKKDYATAIKITNWDKNPSGGATGMHPVQFRFGEGKI